MVQSTHLPGRRPPGHVGCSCHGPAPGPTRRGVLRGTLGGALGAGAALVAGGALTTLLPGPALASGKADTLLLTCMDYRLLDEVVARMAAWNLTNAYDHVILAGASLGALTDKKPGWGPTFFDHLDVAKQLHHIHRVIVIDHRDCGAYKVFLGEDLAGDPAKELSVHATYLARLKGEIASRHADLAVETYLMDLAGEVVAT